MMDGGGMFFGGGLMWIFWLLLIVGLIFVVKTLIGSTGSNSTTDESPLDILKKRFARGEIDEEEFEQRRKELQR